MSTYNLNAHITPKVEVIKRDGTKLDISELVEKVVWSGDYKSCARSLEFSIKTSLLDVNLPKVNIELGEIVKMSTSKELFTGYVVDREKSSGSNSISFLAYDTGFYINQSKGAYNFKNTTPESAASKICTEFGIPKGSFASTGKTMTKVFMGNSLYDIIMTLYTEASKSTGKKYMMYCEGTKVSVIEKGKTVLSLTFKEGNNLIDTTVKETIQKMINKVVICDEKGNKKSEVTNSEWVKLYGVLQDIVKVEEGKDSTTEAKAKLNGVEQTYSLKGYGDTTCITGRGVKIKDSVTGVVGLFYINSDTHTFQNGQYTISLDMHFNNLMDEKSVDQDEKEESNSSTSSSSGSSSSGSSSNNSNVSKMMKLAENKVGNKYVWGATGPNNFDCSGFTSWLHKQSGISIPRTSSAQSKSGKAVSKSNLQPGDLVFFNTNGKGVSHVGMYIGGGKMIHAANSNKGVRYDDINSSYYSSRFVNARRYW